MALILHSPASSFAIKKLHFPLYLPPRIVSSNPNPKDLKIKSQDSSSSSSSKSSQPQKPTESTTTSSSSNVAPPPPKKQPDSAAGIGFGSSASTKSNAEIPPTASKKKQKGKKERASIIRRAPLEKPSFASQTNEVKPKEESQNESAFLLAWLGLGAIILLQGLILAASGFLPQEWDSFFVKYLYPSFTPIVFLFVAGTIAYGLLKYLQNENLKSDK